MKYLVLFGMTGSLCSQEAKARLEASSYSLGDSIPVQIELKHPKGAQFQAELKEPPVGFHVLGPLQFKRQTENATVATLPLARYEVGEATIPALKLSYRLPGEATVHELSTEPLSLKLQAVEVDKNKDIKDLKPPLSLPWTLKELLPWMGGALLLLAGAWGLYRFWKRRKQGPKPIVPAAPPRPPQEVALEALAALRAKKLWEKGLTKAHYSEATEILRRYFEGAFGIAALERTSEEILEDLGRLPESASLRETTGKILREADWVKFAKYLPALSEHERLLDTIQGIVETSSQTLKETAHAGA